SRPAAAQPVKTARGALPPPGLLVLDEPLTGSDPLVRQELIGLIRAYADRGGSVIVSSHVLHEIEQLTPRIVLIHKGRLVADGDIRQIRDLIDRHPHMIEVKAARAR